MITGGAGGIGKSFADQFGKMGINLFLVDFNKSLLDTTKKELESKYPNILVKSKTIDLTELTDEKKYDAFRKEIHAMKIGILFNCAGIAEYKVFRFCANTHKELVSLCNINMIAPTLLYHAVLPQMVERRNGLMLSMASASNMSPQPLLPTYGATKSYIYHLSACLQNQFPTKFSGIYFHAFHPQL